MAKKVSTKGKSVSTKGKSGKKKAPAELNDPNLPETRDRAAAMRLAQVVNLHIAGLSLAEIGAAIGASADEVDRMLATDAARYVRSQPALRTYVRNWVSQRYTKLLDSVWDKAVDAQHEFQLEHQDRAVRILKEMTQLHGAAAPTQAEVKVEAVPEVVDKMVDALAASAGLDFNDSIFDVVDAEVVHEAPEQAAAATLEAAAAVEDAQPGDEEGL